MIVRSDASAKDSVIPHQLYAWSPTQLLVLLASPAAGGSTRMKKNNKSTPPADLWKNAARCDH